MIAPNPTILFWMPIGILVFDLVASMGIYYYLHGKGKGNFS